MKTMILSLVFSISVLAQPRLLFLMDESGIKYNPMIIAYFDSLTTDLDDSVKLLYSDLCDCLDDSLNDGARDKTLLQLGFDRIGLFATQTQEASRRDLVVKTNYTEVSDIAWTQWEGYQGDGSADYINTGFNPASGTNNYTLNSGTFAIYLRNSVNTDFNSPSHGSNDVGNRRIGIRERKDSQGTTRFWVNNATELAVASSGGAGFYASFRTHADTLRGVKNFTFASGLQTATAIPSLNIYLGGINLNNALYAANTHQFAYWFMGKGWYGTNITKIEKCFERYLDRLGKGVIP